MSAPVPVVGCVILRRSAGATEALVGRYSPEHPKEFLRGLLTGTGGKLERLPPVHRTYHQAGNLYCWDCGLSPRAVGDSCRAEKPFEAPEAAALRESAEEAGAEEGQLSPVALESFRALAFGHDACAVREVHAVLLEALPSFSPREMPGERVGGWRWIEITRLPSPLLFSPLSVLCGARFGLRFGG